MPRKTTEAAATTKTKKSVVRRAAKKTTESVVLTWERVAERAYYIHLETGHEARPRTGCAPSRASDGLTVDDGVGRP